MERAAERTWDDEAAAKLVGKRLHLELTYADARGRMIREARFCGRVLAASPHAGIDLALDDERDPLRLPPDLSTFEWAYPGAYPDDVTGGLVEDPDVRATWHITAPSAPPAAFWQWFGRRKGEGAAA